jgi:hypothetical protein
MVLRARRRLPRHACIVPSAFWFGGHLYRARVMGTRAYLVEVL